MKWFRMYSAIIDSPKIEEIGDNDGRWCYVVCLCLASKSPVRGELWLSHEIPISEKIIAKKSQISVKKTSDFLKNFEKLGLIKFENNVIKICDWEEKQFGSDSSTERTRRFKQKQRDEHKGTFPQRFEERNGNAPDTDTDTDTDTDIRDINISLERDRLLKDRYVELCEKWRSLSRLPSLSATDKSGVRLIVDKFTPLDGLETPRNWEWVEKAIERVKEPIGKHISYLKSILDSFEAIGGEEPWVVEKPKSKVVAISTGRSDPRDLIKQMIKKSEGGAENDEGRSSEIIDIG